MSRILNINSWFHILVGVLLFIGTVRLLANCVSFMCALLFIRRILQKTQSTAFECTRKSGARYGISSLFLSLQKVC